LANDLFDFEKRTLRFAVVGHPVSHSKSPRIHEAFARQCGISLSYEAVDLDPIAFEQGVRHLQAGGVSGLNVTLPFKQAAYRLADTLTDRARLANAANTLSFVPSGEIQGDNTDGVGLVRDLEENLRVSLTDAQVLIVGAGGATMGILEPVLSAGPSRLVVANRTPAKARELVERLADATVAQACALDGIVGTFDVVINSTAASLSGEIPSLRPDLFESAGLAYDLAYADQPTPFMRWALSAGAARAVDGLGMLVEQAAESFWVWHQHRPQTAPVIDELRSGIR